MTDVSLYINGERCDMFPDESVELEKAVATYEDVGKILSDFTKSFTLPASKSNNKIFSHYYNADVSGGFDAYSEVDARLECNGLQVAEGSIELLDVRIRDRRPASYSVVFYGEVAGLKLTFGEDRLTDIDWSGLNHTLDVTAVTDSWYGNLQSGNVVYPLYNFERNWIYSTDVAVTADSRNIADSDYGIRLSELKPSVKLYHIWDTIFTDYGLTYEGSIVDSTGPLGGLYMLLHNKAGDLDDIENKQDNYVKVENTDVQTVNSSTWADVTLDEEIADPNNNFASNIFTAPITGRYNVQFSVESVSFDGSSSYTTEIAYTINGGIERVLRVYTPPIFSSYITQTINFVTDLNDGDRLKMRVRKSSGSNDFNIRNATFDLQNWPTDAFGQTVNVTALFPDMRVIDFVRNIMEMFKLVLIPTSTTSFTVKSLESWYEEGTQKDWTKYIDLRDITMKKVPAFKDISFEYADTKDIASQKFLESTGRKYGSTRYEPDVDYADNKLEVKLDFAPSMPVELLNQNVNGNVVGNTGIYPIKMFDKELKPVIDAPRIFYYDSDLLVSCLTYYLQDGQDASGNATFSAQTEAPFCSMFTALNTDATGSTSYNWSLEESYGGNPPINTLYQDYYLKYVQRTFNPQTRILNVKAVLPLGEFINLNLNDNIQVDNRFYTIERIKYNLASEEAELTLISYDSAFVPTTVTNVNTGGGVTLNDGTPSRGNASQFNLVQSGSSFLWRNFYLSDSILSVASGHPTQLTSSDFVLSYNVPET